MVITPPTPVSETSPPEDAVIAASVAILRPDRVAMDKPQRIARMAAALRTYQATATESDALRCLIARGFDDGEILDYLDDALFEARQGVVAENMARR